MASSGYMTIAETRSIWSATLADSTQFEYINVRFGEILNFTVRSDKNSQTDITDARILPILEQLSEEGLMRLIAAGKGSNVSNPWDFIRANTTSVMSQVLRDNWEIIDKLQELQEAKLHVKFSNKLQLPSHSD